jgi:hypothetical protein
MSLARVLPAQSGQPQLRIESSPALSEVNATLDSCQ